MTDADLVARACEGDDAAFGELVRRHHAAVYRAALAALGSPADAEDAAQDALLSAYRRLSGFRGASSFRTWLLTITWNAAMNIRRARRRWWMRGTSLDDVSEMPSAFELPAVDRSPEQMAACEELRRDISRGICALTPKLRDALLLSQSGEYTYEEIGGMLGAPVGTIKWRVSEARRVLKDRLRARGYTHA